jgi:hypothetical protein
MGWKHNQYCDLSFKIISIDDMDIKFDILLNGSIYKQRIAKWDWYEQL